MPFTDEPTRENDRDPEQLAQSLDEINQRLHRMLALAELSASDLDVDRPLLQNTLEQLRREIDRIADDM